MIFYALLMEKPTEEMMICWIDESNAGGEQTIYFGENADSLNRSKVSSGFKIDGDDGYVYHAVLNDLPSDTVIHIDINGTKDHFKTYPLTLSDDEQLKVLIMSDMHTLQGYNNGWNDPSHVKPFVETKPELILIPGDATGNGDVKRFKSLFRDYLSQFNTDGLTPILYAPGNHEMGLYPDPEANANFNLNSRHYRYFVPNLAQMNPVGEGLFYGNVVIGDYLQIISLDTHGVVGTFQAQTNWLRQLTPQANNVYVMQHRGMIHNETKIYHVEADVELPFVDSVSVKPRNGNRRMDDKYQVMQREQWFVPLYFNMGSHFKGLFTGHIHGAVVTRPLKPVKVTPNHTNYLPAGEYNLVRDDDIGVREIGQGFRASAPRYKSNEIPNLLEIGGELESYPYYTSTVTNHNVHINGFSYDVRTSHSFHFFDSEVGSLVEHEPEEPEEPEEPMYEKVKKMLLLM